MSPSSAPFRYPSRDIVHFVKDLFSRLGMRESDAAIAAESLVQAELEGSESHGLSRVAVYADRIREGRIAANPNIRYETVGSILKVGGGNGLGQVVSYHAVEQAMSISEQSGIVGVMVNNSNHFGTAAYFCQQACRANMALIAMTNSPPGIPPWGGKRAFFGTNPIAFGFPTRQEPPVIVDMSSSVVARGKIILADKIGEPIPPGWAIDEEGFETTDPAAALRGAVLPLGGAKGYALALAIEIMTGILSGAAYGPHIGNLYKEADPAANVGHVFILLNIGKWMPLDEYFDLMDRFMKEVKAVPKSAGVDEIFYPGERRYQMYLQRSKQGLSIPQEVINELKRLALETGIPFPEGAQQ